MDCFTANGAVEGAAGFASDVDDDATDGWPTYAVPSKTVNAGAVPAKAVNASYDASGILCFTALFSASGHERTVQRRWRHRTRALIITYTILGVPDYNYSIKPLQ